MPPTDERLGPAGDERVMMHARPPYVASGLACEGVVHGCGQDFGTERQQKLENAVTEGIEVPASLTEEAMKGTKVLELGQIRNGRDFRVSPFQTRAGARYVKAVTPEGALIAIGEARLPNLYHPVLVL